MSHYIHHVPGRLRVKCPTLKRNERGAVEVREYFQGLHGVNSTDINTVTGSLLIRYDPNLVAAQTLLNSLSGLGCIQSLPPLPSPSFSSPHSLPRKIGDTVVDKLVETLVERSAAALIAAIL